MKSTKIIIMLLFTMLSLGIQSNIYAQSRNTDTTVPTTTEIIWRNTDTKVPVTTEIIAWAHDGDIEKAYNLLNKRTIAEISEDLSVTSSLNGGASGDVSKASSSIEGSSKEVLDTSSSTSDTNGNEIKFGEKFFSAIGGALNSFFNAIGL
jgi:hypothetical protein